ncbi:MAG TPA: cysteine--tRNA ligase [Bacteroidales bacterium]|jgi:cysteinyl-tRNA synthetase|nr:cysteine--tRNA ligase [Bacteroidales bacterium]
MHNNFTIYNSLTRQKELFEPLRPPFAGLYVCGPTVYSNAHLGHARPAITFDVLYRYLLHLGYKVRYVRNITDVGHLENDSDEGEDKILKAARAEHLEPMEVVQNYMNTFHRNMDQLNTLKPSIEPRASGHIIEQQEFIRKILKKGYAYESNGSVYFDVKKYSEKYDYGKLSGRVLEELQANTRSLAGQDEKRSPFDFSLWKKATPGHIMKWPSEWSNGFPGWHMECSAMSIKYLGEVFDIHGGGMDLMFPHHECEIAQSTAALGKESVKYWMHNNMITINGQKMARSIGNFITLDQLFSGDHPLLEQPYSPMTIRFFILQAHYRSTVDFSNEALKSAEKGLERLFKGLETLEKTGPSEKSTLDISALEKKCFDAIDDDLNTPVLLSYLFEGVKYINQVNDGKEKLSAADLGSLKKLFKTFVFDILGLKAAPVSVADEKLTGELMKIIIDLRQDARERKDFATSDKIRNELKEAGIILKDRKDGAEWERG